jgi:hypothetical protein
MNEYKLGLSPIVLGNLAADPGVGFNGEIYYNTASNLFRAYIGGAWTNLVSATGANTALSNLTTTSINQDLLPSADLTRNIGSASLRWSSVNTVQVNSGASALALMTANGITSSDVNVTSGNASSGNSGNINLNPGSATATQGNVRFFNNNFFFSMAQSVNVWGGPTPGLFIDSSQNGTDADVFVIGSTDTAVASIATTYVYLISGDNTAVGATAPTGGLYVASGNVTDPTATANTGNYLAGTGSAAGSGNSGPAQIATGNANTGNTGDATFGSGASTSGNSGNVILQIGNAGAVRGKIRFVDGSEGSAGWLWTSSDTLGSGHWVAPSFLPLAGGTMSGAINMGGNQINNLAPATALTDAVSLGQMQQYLQGIDWKQHVRAISTSPLPTNTYNNGASGVGATLTSADGTFPAFAAVDGVTLALNDRIIVNGEANPANNGIYYLSQQGDTVSVPWVLTRSLDANTPTELLAAAAFVDEGTVNALTAWVQQAPATIVIGATALTFAKFASVNPYVFRNGLTQTGQNVDVTPGDNSLTSTPGSLIVKRDPAGAIIVGAAGIAVNPDGTTIDISGNALEVKAGGISNTQIAASAAIALTKLAALNPNRALFSDPSGFITDSNANSPNVVVNMERIGPSTSRYIEKQYVDSITLANNQSSAVAVDASTTFAFATYAGYQAEYYMTDNSSPTIVRMGKLSLVANSDGSSASLTDTSNDTADIGVTFTAVVNGSNIELRYTSTNTSARTMRIDIHRFLR